MKRIISIVIAIFFLVLFIGTMVFLYNKSQAVPEVYATEKPAIVNIIKKTVATGSVSPRKEIAVKSQVSGVVDQLMVEPGDYVKAGQLIARIRIIPNMVNLNNAESNLNKARISYEEAKREYDRNEQLHKEKLISDYEFNQFAVVLKRSKEELDAAENNLQLIKEGVARKSGQASNLVKSTVDGMVLDIPVKQGSFVIESNTFNEGTTIASVADMSEMLFVGKIDESEVEKLQIGMELNLYIGAVEDKTYKAKLEFISPKGVEDQGTVQFEVKAAVMLGKDDFIRAGYSANADIVLDKRDSVLAIKESLLQFDNGNPFVEVETQPQRFEKRALKLGLSDGLWVEVLSGITANDNIKVVLK
ncbi:MAG TPA: efflux RND transporter periplasmic adaptor subunit [Cytophagaceae bacterium]